jgi:hypothetical protein
MSFANGAPSVRVWLVGTKHILGVSEGKYYDPRYCNLPAEILSKVSWNTHLFGDFVFCPFERSQPGVMQLVCVDSANELVNLRLQRSARLAHQWTAVAQGTLPSGSAAAEPPSR